MDSSLDCYTYDRSKIPIRPDSVISMTSNNSDTNNENVNPKYNKRHSILSYSYSGLSRIPRPVLSSNNLNECLSATPSMSNLKIGSSRSKRLSSNDIKQLDSTGIPRTPSLSQMGNSQLDKKRHIMAPTTITGTTYTSSSQHRSQNRSRIDASSQPSQPLKFNYYTSSSLSSSSHKPLSRIDSMKSISSQVNNTTSKLKRSSTISNLSIKRKIEKVADLQELNKIIISNCDLKYRSKFENHTVRPFEEDKLKPYKFEELSSRRIDLFEKFTMYERITQYPEIYFTGTSKMNKVTVDLQDHAHNHGFDDSGHNYKIIRGDHVKYRYEICDILGKGAFGTVITAKDHSYRSLPLYACKIVKNDPKLLLQSIEEIKILKLMQHDNIVRYIEHFSFRSHICIVTELLTLNLYELIQVTKFCGFSIDLVKTFTRDILRGVEFIHSFDIIHCDLKPENLMLAQSGTVKIIDFGSSCHEGELRYSYLQSRFYRAPEVFLGGRYDKKIDIWSAALICLELYAGVPILQPQNEWELFCMCIEYLNVPSRQMISQLRQQIVAKGPVTNNTSRTSNTNHPETLLWKAFDENGGMRTDYVSRKLLREQRKRSSLAPGSKSLARWLRKQEQEEEKEQRQKGDHHVLLGESELLLMFAERLFRWNPKSRLSASEALRQPFLQHVRK